MRIACLMALLAGLGLLAGCGEGSSGSTGSTSASGDLSKSEWIARADEICQAEDEDEDVAAWNKKLDRLNESGLNDPEEVAEFAAILRKVLPKSEQGTRELRELDPPSGDSEAIELEKDEETLGLIKETAKEMEKGNVATAKFLSLKAAMSNRTAQWMAKRDDLELCGVEK